MRTLEQLEYGLKSSERMMQNMRSVTDKHKSSIPSFSNSIISSSKHINKDTVRSFHARGGTKPVAGRIPNNRNRSKLGISYNPFIGSSATRKRNRERGFLHRSSSALF